MSGIRFVGAGVAVALFALWNQEPMAQGLLSASPQPDNGVMSPELMGPPQKFEAWSFGNAASPAGLERAPAPQPQQADTARSGQLQTTRRLVSKPRQTAARSFAHQQDLQRGTVGSGAVMALAPVKPARSRPFCFPSSTIHLQPGQRDACNGGAPAVRGRFEELLSE
jgi:hypothetical protein